MVPFHGQAHNIIARSERGVKQTGHQTPLPSSDSCDCVIPLAFPVCEASFACAGGGPMHILRSMSAPLQQGTSASHCNPLWVEHLVCRHPPAAGLSALMLGRMACQVKSQHRRLSP